MYSFEQLKMFVCVYECGSFSAAARKLGRAQSGISQAIANFEIAINQTLFDRSRSTPVLTPEGQALLPLARSILLQRLRFDQKIVALDAMQEHEFCVAIDDSLFNPELCQLIAQLKHTFPLTQFEVLTSSTFDIRDMVSRGMAQAGVVYSDGSTPDNMDFSTIGHNKFITVVAAMHPLADNKVVGESQLREHCQLVHRSRHNQELWFSHSIGNNLWYVNSHQLMIDFALQGIGWAMVPQQLVQAELQSGALIKLDLDYEPHGWMTTIDLIQTRNVVGGPIKQAIATMLTDYFADANL
ncbi:LysR family transcriptional regulator [Shewanella marina]|uniref:LysR family transcriptional regulator n=1 Tax=Shewanella marina TaxID=487319 RepID=UPI0004723F21|nr:LysR family transcriptional regulator [Shewanella marina]